MAKAVAEIFDQTRIFHITNLTIISTCSQFTHFNSKKTSGHLAAFSPLKIINNLHRSRTRMNGSIS